MKLIIDGPENDGEGVYAISTEDNECLATHFCSNSGYAQGDLHDDRPERKIEWKKRFGDYQVVWRKDL